MPSSPIRPALTLLLLAASITPAAALDLPDSTSIDRWRLANGLEVRTRHVPGAVGVAVAASFRAGRGTDPAGREGQAEVLAQLFFTAPAGEHPARTLADLPALRPLGWGLQVDPRLATLTEIGSRAQLPGILHELGARMRGVTLDEPALKAARAIVRRQFGESRLQRPELAMHHRLREVAEGITDEQLLAQGAALDKLTPREARAMLDKLYVPSNAALVLVGDLEGLEVQRMVESEFGAVPAGVASPEAPALTLTASSRLSTLAAVTKTTAGVGVFAPALEDSLHPAFYLGMMMFGAWCNDHWGKPAPPFTSRFQYAIFEEPELVRFYPPAAPGTASIQPLVDEFNLRVELFAQVSTTRLIMDQFRGNVSWILGGPLTPSILRRAASEGGALGTLATTTAARALFKGDAFWDAYLERFVSTTVAPSTFYALLNDPHHQVVVVFNPPASRRE